MTILPDLIKTRLTTIFCGSAASSASAKAGAYYAGRGNRFWQILHETGLTPRLFFPPEYRDLAELGVGLTDLAKYESGMDIGLSSAAYDAPALRCKVKIAAPKILAFTGKRPAGIFLMETFGSCVRGYGEQPMRLGDARIFVLPSPSGAARRWWTAEPRHRLADTHRALKDVL